MVSEPSKNFQNRRVLGIPFVSRFPRVCGSPERLCNFLDIMQTCPFVKSGGDETTPKLKLRDLHRNEEMVGLIAVSTRPRVSPTRFMWSSSCKQVRGDGSGSSAPSGRNYCPADFQFYLWLFIVGEKHTVMTDKS